MKMEIVVLMCQSIERLEVYEVKKNFINHGLEVDVKRLTKIFKSVAIERKRLDPCNDLSLYEFSIFSKKASSDFKRLINDIKHNMLIKLKRKTSSICVTGKPQGVKSILPLRKANYIKHLPTDFNPLMNHFKDEERRSDIRANLTGTLEDILKIGSNQKKLEEVLEKNEENMKGLIRSHFSQGELDIEIKRMFTQVRKKSSCFLFKSLNTNIWQPKLAIESDEEEGVSNQFKNKVRKRLHLLVTKAKAQGKMEAKELIENNTKLLRSCRQTATSIDSPRSLARRENPRLKTAMKCSKPMKIKPYIQKLLTENLILRTGTTKKGSFKSPCTWRKQVTQRELSYTSTSNSTKPIRCFSSMSNR